MQTTYKSPNSDRRPSKSTVTGLDESTWESADVCVKSAPGTSLHNRQPKQGIKDVVKGDCPPSVVPVPTSRVRFPWHNLYNPQALRLLHLHFSFNVEIRFIFWDGLCCSSSSVCRIEGRGSSFADRGSLSVFCEPLTHCKVCLTLNPFHPLPLPQDWEGLSSWSSSLGIKSGFIPLTFMCLVCPCVSFWQLKCCFYILFLILNLLKIFSFVWDIHSFYFGISI